MVADQTLLAHARAEKCMQPIVFLLGSFYLSVHY